MIALPLLPLAHADDAPRAVVRVEVPAEAAPAPTTPARRWAVLVGVEDYADEQIPDLRFASDDVAALRHALLDSGSWLPDHIAVLSSDADDPAGLPTRANVLRELNAMRDQPDAGLALFYFSGHGVGSTAGGVPTNHLLPSDAVYDPGRSPDNALSEIDLLGKIDQSRAPGRLIVLDACRNLPSGAPALPDAWQPSALGLPSGTWVLRATTFGESSMEGELYGMGVFTHFFVEGLDGAADAQRDGALTVDELFAYTRDALERERARAPGRRGQTPELAGPHPGDLVVLRRDPLPEGRPGLVRVEGNPDLLQIFDASGRARGVGEPLPEGAYTLRARFSGFDAELSQSLDVRGGFSLAVRCDSRFLACDPLGYQPMVEGTE